MASTGQAGYGPCHRMFDGDEEKYEECITDYVIRAETMATSLKTAGETISESLLI